MEPEMNVSLGAQDVVSVTMQSGINKLYEARETLHSIEHLLTKIENFMWGERDLKEVGGVSSPTPPGSIHELNSLSSDTADQSVRVFKRLTKIARDLGIQDL